MKIQLDAEQSRAFNAMALVWLQAQNIVAADADVSLKVTIRADTVGEQFKPGSKPPCKLTKAKLRVLRSKTLESLQMKDGKIICGALSKCGMTTVGDVLENGGACVQKCPRVGVEKVRTLRSALQNLGIQLGSSWVIPKAAENLDWKPDYEEPKVKQTLLSLRAS